MPPYCLSSNDPVLYHSVCGRELAAAGAAGSAPERKENHANAAVVIAAGRAARRADHDRLLAHSLTHLVRVRVLKSHLFTHFCVLLSIAHDDVVGKTGNIRLQRKTNIQFGFNEFGNAGLKSEVDRGR